MNQEEKNLEYKYFIKKVFTILLLASFALILYKISNILIILGISLFLSILFSPFLNKLNKWKIRDLYGIIIIFLLLIFILTLIIFLIVPLIINQSIILFSGISENTNNLLNIYKTNGIQGFGFPKIIENFINNINIEQILTLIKENSKEISGFLGTNIKSFITNGAGVIFSVGTGLFNFVMIFLFTFFIVLERKNIRNIFYALLPKNFSQYIYNNEKDIINVLNVWLKGQLILGISMMFLTLIGLLILKIFGIHVSGIFSLALIAGFMEFIPFIGTFISMFLALSISLGTGLNGFIGVLIVYLIIQQIEGNFLVPYIMGKTLSLSPFIVLISMIIGGALFGIIGVILTIPIISIIKVFITPYLNKRETENKFIK